MLKLNFQFSISDAKAQIFVEWLNPPLRFPILAAKTQIFDSRSSLLEFRISDAEGQLLDSRSPMLKPSSSISDLRR